MDNIPCKLTTDTGWYVEDEAIELIGPPRMLKGELKLRNAKKQRIRIRGLNLKLPRSLGGRESVLAVNRKLLAGESGATSVRLQLPATTPAGQYRATLAYEKSGVVQKQTVNLTVLDHHHTQVMLQPSVVPATAGSTNKVTLSVANLGNQTYKIPAKMMVWFEEQDWLGRTWVHALRETGEDEDYQQLLNRELNKLRKSMVPMTEFKIDAASDTLSPGENSRLTLSFKVPPQCHKGRRYRGFIKLFGKKIWLRLEIDEAEKETEA